MTKPHVNRPLWINRGHNPVPDWVTPHVAEDREPNGALSIRSMVGKHGVTTRVHVDHVVVVHAGVAYARSLAEKDELLLELDELDREAAKPNPLHQASGKRGAERSLKARAAAKPAVQARPASPERKRSYPPPIGARPTIEWLHLDRLSMDASYQRSTDNQASQRLIASIAAGFDWRLCTPLVVSRRADGTFAVIDGQHRLLAARMRGMDDLPCCVFTYDSAEEEAQMFVSANRSRKAMNRLDDFHAAIAAGDSEAHQVRQLVSDAGLSISRNTSSTAWAPGEVAFTASIAATLRKHGAGIVSAALTNIAEAFPGQKLVHAGSIYLGIVKVLTSPPADFDPDRLFRALQRYDAEGWGSFVTGLKGGDTRATAIRDALLMAYEEVETDNVEG